MRATSTKATRLHYCTGLDHAFAQVGWMSKTVHHENEEFHSKSALERQVGLVLWVESPSHPDPKMQTARATCILINTLYTSNTPAKATRDTVHLHN